MPPKVIQLRVSPEEYAEFVRQIELASVFLLRSKVDNYRGPAAPLNATIQIEEGEASFDLYEGGFYAYRSLIVRVLDTSALLAQIDVAFGLQFDSTLPMTEELFEVYSEANLQLTLWPYFREFAASAFSRMNWQPFTLPTRKAGLEPVLEQVKPKKRRSPKT